MALNTKSTNIAILLVVVAIAVIVVMQFFGFSSFMPQPAPSTADSILSELQTTGTVADLRVQTVVEGEGDAATVGDVVTVKYTGVLPDGIVFDSTASHGDAVLPGCTEAGVFCFTLGQGAVIQGWERGILGMKPGERRLLVIPPSLGYGAAGNGPIPPNATLIFDVELVSLSRTAQ